MVNTEDKVRDLGVTVRGPNRGFTGVIEEKTERDRGNISRYTAENLSRS